jgi:protocatechuate 3,4-dioxygenase beta subunit
MRGRSILILAATLATLLCAQPSGTGVISGTVIDSSSGDPVRKAVVTVTWHGTPRSWATLQTDGAGKFRFENLPKGVYDIRATKNGGIAIYGAKSTRETGDNITLADGETRADLRLRFLHYATISGRVLDSDGDPVTARVMLMRATRNFGRRVLVNGGPIANTNLRGEYRIGNVQPGQYYLLASSNGPMNTPFQPNAPGPAPDVLAPQFFGGTTDSDNAAMLNVKEDQALAGIDFRLPIEKAVRIHGHITGVPDSVLNDAPPPPGRGRVPVKRGPPVILQVTSLAEGARMSRSTGVGSDYSFDIGWMAPGRYRVSASVTSDRKTYAGSQLIDSRSDPGEVTLALVPAGDLMGRLRIEGTLNAKRTFTVALSQAEGDSPNPNGRKTAQVAESGAFTLPQVTPGEWNVDVTQLPPGAFIKSVTYGDQDALFKPFELHPGSDAVLDIVVSLHSAKLTGSVESPRAAIVLAPVGRFHDLARYYYAVVADEKGNFRMIGIAPGKYKLFAVEKLAPPAFRNPEGADQVCALFADYIGEIDLKEDAELEVHPKPIPMERAKEILP